MPALVRLVDVWIVVAVSVVSVGESTGGDTGFRFSVRCGVVWLVSSKFEKNEKRKM